MNRFCVYMLVCVCEETWTVAGVAPAWTATSCGGAGGPGGTEAEKLSSLPPLTTRYQLSPTVLSSPSVPAQPLSLLPAPGHQQLLSRACRCVWALGPAGERAVLVVSHGGFLACSVTPGAARGSAVYGTAGQQS